MNAADYYQISERARSIYPEGLPTTLPLTRNVGPGSDDMSWCYVEVLQPTSKNVPEVELDAIVSSFDCISFIDGEDAAHWIGLWMMASFYAEDFGLEPNNVHQWTETALVRSLRGGDSPVPLRAVESFADMFEDDSLDPSDPTLSSPLSNAVEDYRRRLADQYD